MLTKPAIQEQTTNRIAADVSTFALLRLSALGDVTLLLPIIHSLQKAIPHAHITWITGTGAYQLLQGVDNVEFIVIDKPSQPKDYLAFGKRLAGRKFDVLLAAQANLRANLLYPWIPAERKIGFDRVRAREGQWVFTKERIPFKRQHLMDSFFALLEAQGIDERVIEWRLPVFHDDEQWAVEHVPAGEGPLVILNPGASKLERVWLPERYIELIRELRQNWNARVILTGNQSAAERGLAAFISHQMKGSVTNLAGQTTPKQLAALISKADCVIAPDTGPVHIAVAMGTPVVGLYAVAPSWLSGPYLYRDLVVDRYDEAVRTILKRDPAEVPWGMRVHDNQAMALIQVQDVLESVARVIEST